MAASQSAWRVTLVITVSLPDLELPTMYKRILVPIDGSDTSRNGLNAAIHLAKGDDATLSLLHVVNEFPLMVEMASTTDFNAVREGMRQYGLQLLADTRMQATSQGLKVETLLIDQREGRVSEAIVEQAKAEGCDLIVIGSHGRRGLSRLLLGSDAAGVLRQSAVPVLLVRDARAA